MLHSDYANHVHLVLDSKLANRNVGYNIFLIASRPLSLKTSIRFYDPPKIRDRKCRLRKEVTIFFFFAVKCNMM